MATIPMREVREGEVPRDGGTALQEDPDRPVFRGNGPDDYVCVECGNLLAEAMHPVQMTRKVRVRCGRCSTVNVSVIDGYTRPSTAPGTPGIPVAPGFAAAPPAPSPSTAAIRDDRRADAWPAGAWRGPAARRRYARSRCTPSEAEALPRREAALRDRRCAGASAGCGRLSALLVLLEIECDRGVGAIEVEGRQAERGEVRRLVDLDHGAGRLVHQVDGEQQVLAGRVKNGDVPVETCVDRLELLDRRRHRPHERRISPGLRDAFEPDVALLAQPVERLTLEHDSVGGRGLRES